MSEIIRSLGLTGHNNIKELVQNKCVFVCSPEHVLECGWVGVSGGPRLSMEKSVNLQKWMDGGGGKKNTDSGVMP